MSRLASHRLDGGLIQTALIGMEEGIALLFPGGVNGAHLSAQAHALTASGLHAGGDAGLDVAEHGDGAEGGGPRVVLELVGAGAVGVVVVEGLADRLADRGGGRGGAEEGGREAVAKLAGDADGEGAEEMHGGGGLGGSRGGGGLFVTAGDLAEILREMLRRLKVKMRLDRYAEGREKSRAEQRIW